MVSAVEPCGSIKASPLPFWMSCTAIFSKSVDFPMPVLPMTYMCLVRSFALIPNGTCWPRASVLAKNVICSGSNIRASSIANSAPAHGVSWGSCSPVWSRCTTGLFTLVLKGLRSRPTGIVYPGGFGGCLKRDVGFCSHNKPPLCSATRLSKSHQSQVRNEKTTKLSWWFSVS